MSALTIAHEGAAGRLRLRAAALRGRPDLCRAVEAALSGRPGIERAEARARTGSLILCLTPGVARRAALDRAEAALRAAQSGIGGDGRAAPGAASPGSPARPAQAPAREDGPGWHALAPETVIRRLATSGEAGLAPGEAEARLRRHGPNRLPHATPPGALALVARQVNSLPVMLLAGSSVVSLATGGVTDAAATLVVIVVNAVIGYATEAAAERTIHAMMDDAARPARVLRGGSIRAVASDALVPGDVLLLEGGHTVPADARVIAAEDLAADEAALTGESLPVAKAAGAVARTAPIAERPGMVHAGTLIAQGTGRAVIVATGARTEAAAIQSAAETGTRPPAPIETELDSLGSRLAKASVAACVLFVGVGVVRGYPAAALMRDALALAVAAVPEGLPMVATTTLSLGLRRMERKGILIRDLRAVESLGALQTLCFDKTGTLTENRMTVSAAAAGTTEAGLDDRAALAPLAEIAALNAEAGAASPTEAALQHFAEGMGIDAAALARAHPRRRTVPRGPDRPWVTTEHGGEPPLMAVKGAPEAVLRLCSAIRENGESRPITAEDRERIAALNDRLAARPARVLAMARGAGAAGGAEPGGLTFLGLLAMTDPIRPGARAFVRALHRAGIETVLITGDQAATAGAVARALDLSQGAPLRIIDSSAPGALDPRLLSGLVPGTHVFARVSSHQKRAIVAALQGSGRVVAMTGDGVNDAPALAAAEVGIAMGASGTQLAREVGNVVIADDELPTLLDSIQQGRALYRNIRRALEFLVTTNISEIVVSIAEAAEGPGALETPMELLWINLVTDVLPGLGLALADPDPDLMDQPPRDAGEAVIPRTDLARMGRDSTVIAGTALAAHFAGRARHGFGPRTRAMTFLTLSLGQLLYTLACQRRDPRRIAPGTLFENRNLDMALAGSVGLAVAPHLVPGLGRVLGIGRLGGRDAALSLALAAVPVTSVLARRGVVIERRRTVAAHSRTETEATECAISS